METSLFSESPRGGRDRKIRSQRLVLRRQMGDRRIRFLLKSLSLWLLGALAISIPLSRFNLVRFYHLKHEGVQTNGIVTKLDASNHQAVYYEYEAAGQTHSGSGMAGFGNPEFCCLARGQKVIVYYLRSDPSTSCIGIPDDLIRNEVPPIVGAAVVFPILFIVVYSYRIPRFKRWLVP
jgi:hypothetical protein